MFCNFHIDASESRTVDEFIQEGLQMRAFDHPNVMYLIGICWTLDNVQNSPRIAPLIVLPYMELGDLQNFLKKSRLDQEEEQVITTTANLFSSHSCIPAVALLFQGHIVELHLLIKFCLQIAKGMEYLVSRGIIHRDLAARNCM